MKAYKYTLLTLALAFLFIVGSMKCMSFMLKVREEQLMTESGRAVLESPVRAWREHDREHDMASESERHTLATGQIEEAVSCWNERARVIIHNPVDGQISMEEAIAAGEKWIAEMEIKEGGQEEQTLINATLGVAGQKESEGVQLEPYYSFWTINFSSRSMQAVLYINAVAGRVWGAEITLYEAFPEIIPREKLKRFVESAGLETSGRDGVENLEGTQAYLKIDDSRMFAEMAYWNPQKIYIFAGYGEKGDREYDEETRSKNGVKLIFKLNVEKDFTDMTQLYEK